VNTRLRFLLSFSLLLGVLRPARAQAIAAVCEWLTISPSTAANGMGNLALPYSTDPMAAWLLPGVSAIGPNAAEGVTIEFTGHRPRTDWFPELDFGSMSLGHKAVRVRAPMDRALDRVSKWVPGIRWRPASPMSLSFSVMQQEFHEMLDWSERSTSSRLELGWHTRAWNFGAGLGYDFITCDIDYYDLDYTRVSYRREARTLDWGMVAERKLLDRVPLRSDAVPFQSAPLLLDLGVTGSWARNFVGGEVEYFPDEQGDPLPRGDRLALASRFRVVHPGSGSTKDLDLLRVHVAYEHAATLIDKYLSGVQVNGIRDTDPGGWATTHFEGDDIPDTYFYGLDYKLFEPGIFTVEDETERRWGAEISLFDMVTVRTGRVEIPMYRHMEDTRGWGLDSNGLFVLLERKLPATRSTPVLGWMLRSMRVRYDKSEWDSNPFRNGTQFRQVTVDVAF
jgi:hypothetical protein